MPERSLTNGEIAILRSVFANTLPYDTQLITTNDANMGGASNSITYSSEPHYSNQIWCADFSASGADTWTFVHEFGHVWQSLYGTPPVLGWLSNLVFRDAVDYDKNYYYDLTKSSDFWDYNIEQQASIVADFWAVSNSQNASKYCQPAGAQASSFSGFITQVQNAQYTAGSNTPSPQGPDPSDGGLPGGT